MKNSKFSALVVVLGAQGNERTMNGSSVKCGKLKFSNSSNPSKHVSGEFENLMSVDTHLCKLRDTPAARLYIIYMCSYPWSD